MILKTKGTAHLVQSTIIGRVTRHPIETQENLILIAEQDLPRDASPYKAVLTELTTDRISIDKPCVYGVGQLDFLVDGDIVAVHSDGIINTLYRVKSHQNFLLVTERCNSNCLMCSQPPKDREDIPFRMTIHRQLIPLIPKDCPELGITGGEPTLAGELFFELLHLLQSELPDTEIHCLTNGRVFAWPHIAKRLGLMKYNRLMLGIPVYSDYYQVHDYIVQAKDAFHQTIQGIYHLAEWGQRMEIRVVLHRKSLPRLRKLSHFLYRNLPFIEHVAFMGLEYQGYTPHNFSKLWIDPVEYMDDLQYAVEYLSEKGVNVSIYNLQLCLLPRELWQFSRKSISDWKNVYVDECTKCDMMQSCAGLFASNSKLVNKGLKALQQEESGR